MIIKHEFIGLAWHERGAHTTETNVGKFIFLIIVLIIIIIII